jgi:hypothetical protein
MLRSKFATVGALRLNCSSSSTIDIFRNDESAGMALARRRAGTEISFDSWMLLAKFGSPYFGTGNYHNSLPNFLPIYHSSVAPNPTINSTWG